MERSLIGISPSRNGMSQHVPARAHQGKILESCTCVCLAELNAVAEDTVLAEDLAVALQQLEHYLLLFSLVVVHVQKGVTIFTIACSVYPFVSVY